jgi:protein TonB
MNTTFEQIDPTTERFAVALFIATAIHLVIIYGMGFSMPTSANPLNTTMEVILVQKSTEKEPKKPDYLAQVSHEGGGEHSEKARPVTPTIAPFPDQTAEIVFTPPPPLDAAAPTEDQTEIVTTEMASEHQVERHEKITPPEEPAQQGSASQTSDFEEYISESLIYINASAARLASIQVELNEKFENYTKKPRRKFISSSTTAYGYAEYMVSSVKKIEKVGTDFYNKQPRLKEIVGILIFNVAINPDGTIHHLEIKKPSKIKVLDDTALRIIHRAAPFDPFPENIRKETDILHITRILEFRYNGVSSR